MYSTILLSTHPFIRYYCYYVYADIYLKFSIKLLIFPPIYILMPRHGRRPGRGRGRCPRRVESLPHANYYKPVGVPMATLEVTTLLVEEFEAFRLVDSEGLDQIEAASQMGISRKTLWVDLKAARKKIADALAHGQAIRIQGGSYMLQER
jgi:predicted DNA-binding protein (UPF0251 family)